MVLLFFVEILNLIRFLNDPKSIKYLSIKYSSQDNKLIVNLLVIVKNLILNIIVLLNKTYHIENTLQKNIKIPIDFGKCVLKKC